MTSGDQRTADAFATSWNNLPRGSVYTPAQVADWFAPLGPGEVRGRRVLEMGCGNASLMVHVAGWGPSQLDGIDLGDSVESARANLTASGARNWSVKRADLVSFASDGYDVVYSIASCTTWTTRARGSTRCFAIRARAGASIAGCTRARATAS
jgi:protein-L-isoaspartate O-methyltransferase